MGFHEGPAAAVGVGSKVYGISCQRMRSGAWNLLLTAHKST